MNGEKPIVSWKSFASRSAPLIFIPLLAAILRFPEIGRLSYSHDEVLSINAVTNGTRSFFRSLDSARPPLYPILLHFWTRIFGPEEAASRSFSAACGVSTAALVYLITRRAFEGRATALGASWLVALSPLLIACSRDMEMDAWLTLVTCASWYALFSLSTGPTASTSRLVFYALGLTALGFSHPLGLLMTAALATASALNARAYGLNATQWLAAHLGAASLFAPWIKQYLDSVPFATGPSPSRTLLVTLIGFTGGNVLTLAPILLVVVLGLLAIRKRETGRHRPSLALDAPTFSLSLLIWVAVPPVLLWVSWRVSRPIFGPVRSLPFVGPAYLILLARGLARLPRWLGIVALLAVSGLAIRSLPTWVYAPDRNPDWRAMAAVLDRRDPGGLEPVLVGSGTNDPNREIRAARYYLGPKRPSLPLPCPVSEVVALRQSGPPRLWLALETRDGWLAAPIPDGLRLRRDAETLDAPGLRLIAVDPGDLP